MADLRYPIKNIGPQDDYLKIQILEYQAPGLNLTGGFALGTTEQALGAVKNVIQTIILPMPANIQDNNAADWTTGTMNPLQAGFANAASSAVLAGNPFGSITESLK